MSQARRTNTAPAPAASYHFGDAINRRLDRLAPGDPKEELILPQVIGIGLQAPFALFLGLGDELRNFIARNKAR